MFVLVLCEVGYEVMVVVFDCDCFGVSNLLILDLLIWFKCIDYYIVLVVGMLIDCVYLVLIGLFEFELDIVVLGINNVVNFGDDVIYFGIVLVVMEGCFFGLLVVVVLLVICNYDLKYFDIVVWVVVEIVVWFKVDLLFVDIIFNVNVLDLLWSEVKGFEVICFGNCYCVEGCIVQKDLCGNDVYWIGLVGCEQDFGLGIDFYVVCIGYILIMLIQVDLICYQVLEKVVSWVGGFSVVLDWLV